MELSVKASVADGEMMPLKQKLVVLYTTPDVRERVLSVPSRFPLGSSSVISARPQRSDGYFSVISAVSVLLSAISAKSQLLISSSSAVSVEPRLRLGG